MGIDKKESWIDDVLMGLTLEEDVVEKLPCDGFTVYTLRDKRHQHPKDIYRLVCIEDCDTYQDGFAGIQFYPKVLDDVTGEITSEVMYKATREGYRRQGFQNGLWSYAQYVLAKYDNSKPVHSKCLTELGILSIRELRGEYLEGLEVEAV